MLIILHTFLLDPANSSLDTQEYNVLLSKTLYESQWISQWDWLQRRAFKTPFLVQRLTF